jgi:hypothetical protein
MLKTEKIFRKTIKITVVIKLNFPQFLLFEDFVNLNQLIRQFLFIKINVIKE